MENLQLAALAGALILLASMASAELGLSVDTANWRASSPIGR